jgi:hypothetical protein
VSKHKQTEGKLGQQAWKLVFMNDEFEQDLVKLHNKLIARSSTLKGITKTPSRISTLFWR